METGTIGASELLDRRIVPLDKCFNCKREQAIYARETEFGGKTLNFIGICQNAACFRRINLSLLRNWVRVPNAQAVKQEQQESNAQIYKENNYHHL